MRKPKNTAEAAPIEPEAGAGQDLQTTSAETAPPETPQTATHVAGWAGMTTGIEDYARWQQEFAERTGAGDPPFRRGRIWA